MQASVESPKIHGLQQLAFVFSFQSSRGAVSGCGCIGWAGPWWHARVAPRDDREHWHRHACGRVQSEDHVSGTVLRASQCSTGTGWHRNSCQRLSTAWWAKPLGSIRGLKLLYYRNLTNSLTREVNTYSLSVCCRDLPTQYLRSYCAGCL